MQIDDDSKNIKLQSEKLNELRRLIDSPSIDEFYSCVKLPLGEDFFEWLSSNSS